MKLYNSLTKKIENFVPLNRSEITLYSCGPTVYERAHIGNLASFIYADTLRRALTLEFPDAKIKHVMNITDVDDKTIKSSQERYPELEPMEALKKLTRHLEDLFMQDLEAVGVDVSAITFVRATDYITQMQELIHELLKAGIAYAADDGIYFSIKTYQEAGKKYGQLVDITAESTGAARVNNDEYDKDFVHDFALWKKQKPGEPAWDFEVDGHDMKGRPGWHIECSTMSVAELGQPFDIHTGGVDLKFPHHENEIAQSTASGQDLLARFFFHSEHMLVDGKKMSKSLNNFITLEDIKAKSFDPLAFRLLVLQSHYRNQAHFSWENLEAAQNRLKRFNNLSERQFQIKNLGHVEGMFTASPIVVGLQMMPSIAEDLNTAAGLASIEEFIDNSEQDDLSGEYAVFSGFIKLIDGVFGLRVSAQSDIRDDQKQIIAEREAARINKDFAKSDELRDKLANQGIGLRDTPHGPIWFRV